jgi:hypothetical protein
MIGAIGVTQPALSIGGIVHIAGPVLQVGNQLRQRCGWCGAVLLDYDLANTLSPCDDRCQADGCRSEHHRPGTWPAGELVEVAGPASVVLPHEDGAELPANACAQRCRCGKIKGDCPGCTWHDARQVAELTAALKRIDWQVGREQGSQWLAGELVRLGVRVKLDAEVTS